jgi:hypothetical protein
MTLWRLAQNERPDDKNNSIHPGTKDLIWPTMGSDFQNKRVSRKSDSYVRIVFCGEQ